MKITIDTKEDTHDDIRKVIRLLTHLIGEHPTTNQPNLFDEPSSLGQSDSDSGSVFGNMFNDSQPSGNSSETTEDTKEDETPEIIPY